MEFRFRKQFKQATGKVRRFLLLRFQKNYVDRQLVLRQGECNQCGNCCEILFRCPFLVKWEDGSSMCSIYEDRPGQCAAFPINKKCLAEVDFDCTYFFAPSASQVHHLMQIESPVSNHQIADL